MPQIALNLVCPESGCRFATKLTCQTRKAQLNSAKAAHKFIMSFRHADICKTCPGPVPISEYQPKPRRDYYVEPPLSVEEPPENIIVEKRNYNRSEPLLPYGLASFLPGEKRIFACPADLNPRTLKSRLQREASQVRRGKFKFSKLFNSIRAERLKGEKSSTWRGKGEAPNRGLAEMQPGDVKIIEFVDGEKISTVKSQVAREALSAGGKFRTRLLNGSLALRVEREI